MLSDKTLYEKIIHNISKSIKQILNEEILNFDVTDYQDDENETISQHTLQKLLYTVQPKTLDELKKLVAERFYQDIENPYFLDIDTSLITSMRGYLMIHSLIINFL